MKKLRVAFGCAIVSAFAAFAENPPPYEDYVTLTNSDATGSSGSFHSAGYWSDGLAPHTDASYYVPAGKTLSSYAKGTTSAEDRTWRGGPLVIAGTYSQTVSGGHYLPTIADITFVDNSTFAFPGPYTGFASKTKVTILAAEDQPCLVAMTANNYNSSRAGSRWNTEVYGAAGTGLRFWGNGSAPASGCYPYKVLRVYPNDAFKNFYGTLTIDGDVRFQYYSSDYYTDFSGKVLVKDGATFNVGNGAATDAANVATLEVQDGASVNLGYNKGTACQVLAIADSMKLAAGATVILDDGSSYLDALATLAKLDSAGRHIRAKAAVLSGDAVANSEIAAAQVKLLDFDADPFWKESFGDIALICEDGENGTKIVYAGFTNDNFAVNCASVSSDSFSDGGKSGWAGGVLPEAGNDIIFTSSGKFYITSNHEDILSSSRIVWAGNSGDITSGPTLLNFKSLDVFGATYSSIRQSSSGSRKLTGGPLTIHDGARLNFGIWNQTGSGTQYRPNATIMQEIRGNGTLQIRPYSANASNRLDIVSVNTNWHGRFVFQLQCNDRSGEKYSTQITNALCWGGTFLADADTYSAVTISNNPCIHVPNDVCFNEPTRGFSLNDAPRFNVAEGAKLTLSNQVTYAGIVEKEGAGVLNLGGTARFEDGQSETAPVDGRCGLVVSAGALEVSSQEACDGLQVSFAEGTKFVVSKDCGFYNVKSANPLTIADEKLQVEIKGFDERPEEDVEVTVLTLSEAAAANLGTEKFAFPKTKACQVTGFEKRPAGDGKVDYVAKVTCGKGLYILFK